MNAMESATNLCTDSTPEPYKRSDAVAVARIERVFNNYIDCKDFRRPQPDLLYPSPCDYSKKK